MDNKKSQEAKVFVGISGGVDSAVAALLLKKRRFAVRGIFMKCWSPESAGIEFSGECQWERDQRDAKHVAEYLGIPFETWNFEREYKEKVVDYMIKEYRIGRTPNPDVMCNREIKFGLFLKRALQEGADYVATGHYARVAQPSTFNHQPLTYRLLTGKDTNKDQSYFLYLLNQQQLAKVLFPIGDYTKEEVRKIAKEAGLPNWDRPDSQGICFVGELDLRQFLKMYIKENPGKIVTSSGKVIGSHVGLSFYTIGQRQGIGIGGGIPFYVAKKQAQTNTLLVAEGENDPVLYAKELILENVHWIFGKPPKMPFRCKARIRYRQPLQSCRIEAQNNADRTQIPAENNSVSVNTKFVQVRVIFGEEQRAVTPGQSVVFYKGEEVVGGGVIQ